jgi:hypothetical protein
MASAGPTINSPEELEHWLADKPPQWAQVIAARAALRVFPLVFRALDVPEKVFSDDKKRLLILQTFRANFISWAAGMYPAQDISATHANNASAALSDSESVAMDGIGHAPGLSGAVAAAGYAIKATTGKRSIFDARQTAGAAAEAISRTLGEDVEAARAVAEFWAAVDTDFGWLESNEGALIVRPLWLVEVRDDPAYPANIPSYVRARYERFAEDAGEQSIWRLITEWYRAILPANAGATPRSFFGERLDLDLASRPDEFWHREPGDVLEEIAKLTGFVSATAQKEPLFTVEGNVFDDMRKQQSTPPDAGTPADPNIRTDTSLQSDLPEGEADHLGRADVAFMLASRLQQVWDMQAGLNKDEPSPSFVVHIDAPWGGGKSTFANYLVRILNPHIAGRSDESWKEDLPGERLDFWRRQMPWQIVQFNAWQKQHVRPPWWVFYRGLHRQTLAAVWHGRFSRDKSASKNAPGDRMYRWHDVENGLFVAWSWLREMAWRLWVPGNRVLVVTSLVSLAVLLLLWWSDVLVFTPATDKSKGGWEWSGMFGVIVAGLTFLGTTFGAFAKSLFIGTPDAADNYQLGSEDPLQYFKRHYNAYCASLRRPILVIVDDLDRCKPEFVTELLAGFQTVLASPPVIILLLGDKDWLEESFVQSNKAMKDIDVGPEHGFGARFVEKVIQLSITLPDIDAAVRRGYLDALLGMQGGPVETGQAIPEEVRREIDQVVRSTGVRQLETAAFGTVEQLSAREPAIDRKTLERYAAREVSLKASTDVEQEEYTRHQLQGLSDVLPPNPRQIKRIVNTVTLVAGVARAQFELRENTPEWRKLARWIVLMTEWPQTWFTLTTHPQIADSLDLDWAATDVSENPELQWAKTIAGNRQAMDLIAFSREEGRSDWPDNEPITSDDIRRMAMIMPATSGVLLSLPEESAG